ncbi:hypothetical protein H7170_01765 [Candidatus Gracilibacteria bacterium]|nr:hypothetical protein [Candidatus Gracilibacteria bacterium]
MKSPLKIGLNLLTLSLISLGLYNANKAEAINTINDGWRMESAWEIDTLEGCVAVTNQSGIRYIPTRTWAEWNQFKSIAASQGMNLTACPPVMPVWSGDGDGGGGGDGASL